MLRVASSPPILLMVAKVYVPVLFPLTFGIALAAARLDRLLGLDGGMIAAPARYAVAAALLAAGLAIVGVSYAELVTAGEGSAASPCALLEAYRSAWCGIWKCREGRELRA
jgi:hypothetical protein